MGSNSEMNKRIKNLKDEIESLNLISKGKNLKTKEDLYKTVGDVYENLKKICPKGTCITTEGKPYMYIKSRLNLLGEFCWKILGYSGSHTIGGGWKSMPNSLTHLPSVLSKKSVDEVKSSYHSERKELEKSENHTPSLTLNNMNNFVDDVCESYEKNLQNIVNNSVEKITTES